MSPAIRRTLAFAATALAISACSLPWASVAGGAAQANSVGTLSSGDSFCKEQVIRNFAEPLEDLPALHHPPLSRRLPFAKKLELVQEPPSGFAEMGGAVGFSFEVGRGVEGPAAVNWMVKARLTRVTASGELAKPVRSLQRRVRKVPGSYSVLINLKPDRLGLFRFDLAFYGAEESELGSYSEYFRMLRPVKRVRLRSARPIYRSGEDVRVRFENLGTGKIKVAISSFGLERLEAGHWIVVPELPRKGVDPGRISAMWPGTAGECIYPQSTTEIVPGRYRIWADALVGKKEHPQPVSTEFSVEP
jgi:hypothetical protein